MVFDVLVGLFEEAMESEELRALDVPVVLFQLVVQHVRVGEVGVQRVDDLFGFLLYLTGPPAVTRQLEVRYDSPVLLGVAYELVARIVGAEGRKLFVEAEMSDTSGGSVAFASALFLRVDGAHFRQGASNSPPLVAPVESGQADP